MFNTSDKTLVCSDCGREFTFSASEQEFFQKKGFNDPSRCPECRAARKASRGEGGGGGSSFGSSREPRQMYPAVCAQCGKPTEVPFQPRGDKPVYCSDCYNTQRGGSSSYGGGRSSGGGGGSRGGGSSRGGGGGSSRW